jgi:hypothetical protein
MGGIRSFSPVKVPLLLPNAFLDTFAAFEAMAV